MVRRAWEGLQLLVLHARVRSLSLINLFCPKLRLHFSSLFPHRVPVLCICVVDGKSTRSKRGFRTCWPEGPYYKSCYKWRSLQIITLKC
jgi:hypothetical protein